MISVFSKTVTTKPES